MNVSGCTSIKLAPFEGKPVTQYKNHQTKNGLLIAVDPITDKKESKKYFGVDLTSKNIHILAVYITAENKSPSSSFMILKKSIKLSHKSIPIGRADNNEPSDETKKKGDLISCVGVGGAFVLPLLCCLFVGQTVLLDSTIIDHSVKSQEFQTLTLSPGEKGSGFLYFKMPKMGQEPKLFLHIEAINPISKEITAFEYKIKIK